MDAKTKDPSTTNDAARAERRLRIIVAGLMLLTVTMEFTWRALGVGDFISGSIREYLGVLTFIPLLIATVLVHRHIRQRTYIKTLFVLALSLLLLAQIIDAAGQTSGNDILEGVGIQLGDALLYALGAGLLFSACYLGLLEAATAWRQSERDRELLSNELERRRDSENTLLRAHGRLEAAVARRSTELEVRRQQLAQELTVRRAAERAVHESESLLKAVVDAAPMFLWALDANGIITLDSGSGLKLLGLEQGRNVGMNVFQVAPENHEAISLARRALQGEACTGFVDFAGLTLRTTYTPLRDAEGVVHGAIGVAIDVTHERKLENRIRQKQKMEAIGALAGGIAHDFNNILYALDGYAALVAKEVAGMPHAAECVSEMRTTVARATDLVDRIVALARHESPRRIPVDLVQEAENTVRLLAPTLPPNVQLKLSVECDAKVVGDPAHLRQVFLNLAANARYAMRDTGGVLGIRLTDVVLPEALASTAEAPPRFVILEISDSGPGIESPALEQMFEPFFTTKPLRDGSGLGLAIVRSVVEAHDGHIEVETEKNKGATFRIYLPTEPPPLEHKDDPEQHNGNAGHRNPKRRVVVVDDEPQIRLVLRMILQDAGHELQIFSSGKEAAAAMTSNGLKADLLLTDLVMPENDGMSLVRAVREKHPTLPVIICSGFPDGIERAGLDVLENAAFLRKPINPRELLDLVQTMTARKDKE